MELNVFVDDGKGFVDLGLDNIFTIDGNDLIFDYDRTWTTVNGTLVSYYMTSDTVNDDGSWVTRGRIPAILTRKDDSGALIPQCGNYVFLPHNIAESGRTVFPVKCKFHDYSSCQNRTAERQAKLTASHATQA